MRRQSTDPVDLVPLHLEGEKEQLLTLPHVEGERRRRRHEQENGNGRKLRGKLNCSAKGKHGKRGTNHGWELGVILGAAHTWTPSKLG